jgi:hypothetical protein
MNDVGDDDDDDVGYYHQYLQLQECNIYHDIVKVRPNSMNINRM